MTISDTGGDAMENFDLWLRACDELDMLPHRLEGSGDTAVYVTHRTYEYQHNYYHTDRVYHVWIHGRQLYCGMDYQTAIRIWEGNH